MMARELMWICAIAPEEFRSTVTRLCLAENKSVGLPENVFKLPLHISLKKSFYTEDFDSAKDDILKLMNGVGRFRCRIDTIALHRNMLWLLLKNDGELRDLHERLDCLLETKYNIPISRYDRIFQPHISLFTRGTQEQLRTMYDRLKSADFGAVDLGNEIEICRFVIGSSGHKDAFYDLE